MARINAQDIDVLCHIKGEAEPQIRSLIEVICELKRQLDIQATKLNQRIDSIESKLDGIDEEDTEPIIITKLIPFKGH